MLEFGISELAALRKIAERAGTLAKGKQEEILRSGLIEFKDDLSPVTEADRETEALIRSELQELFPGARLVGEEFGVSEGDGGSGANYEFLIDPIDGTRAFLRGIPTWSVLLTVRDRDVGDVLAGVAVMPALDETYHATRGHGAFCGDKRLQVSGVQSLSKATVLFGDLKQFSHCQKVLSRVAEQAYTTRAFADFANYRELLLGRVDAVVDPAISNYDVGPAAILVREAGGRFTCFNGTDSIDHTDFLASNGLIHDELLSLVD